MKKMFLIFLVSISFAYGQTTDTLKAVVQTTDTIKVLYLTAKKSLKYNTYTPVILKGFVLFQNDPSTNGIELKGYLDEKKQILKSSIIVFGFTPIN
jgi:hypothetical protein